MTNALFVVGHSKVPFETLNRRRFGSLLLGQSSQQLYHVGRQKGKNLYLELFNRIVHFPVFLFAKIGGMGTIFFFQVNIWQAFRCLHVWYIEFYFVASSFANNQTVSYFSSCSPAPLPAPSQRRIFTSGGVHRVGLQAPRRAQGRTAGPSACTE